MKIAISSYSFQRLLDNKSMTLFDCIEKAKEIGFDGIEFTDLIPADDSDVSEYAQKISNACQNAGLTISNYTVGADFINGSRGNMEAEINRLKRQVDIASILGVTSMRHDATSGFPLPTNKGFEQALPILAKGCLEITDYAMQKGIRTMVENHGFFCQDSERVEKLINTVAHPNFGWLCDMGNFLCADENPALAVSRASRYAFYVHAKDFVVKAGSLPNPGEGFLCSRGGNYLKGTIIGHGEVPVVQCISTLKRNGYDGFVGIEFEGMEDTLTAITIGHQNLRRYIQMA